MKPIGSVSNLVLKPFSMKVCQGWTRRVFEVKSTSAIVTKVIMIIIIINISLASCFLCYGLNFLV